MRPIAEFINRIILGDCLEVMKDIPDKGVDLILTDPPYGINHDTSNLYYGSDGFEFKSHKQYKSYSWDIKRPDKRYFDEIMRIGKKVMIFGGNYFADLLPQSTHWIVWDKLVSMPSYSNCELIYSNLKKNSVRKIVYEYNGALGKEKDRFHPTQKPIKLLSVLIQTESNKGDFILDPFCGSGTTCVAAKQLDRCYCGVEIIPEYYEITRRRLKEIDAIQEEFGF